MKLLFLFPLFPCVMFAEAILQLEPYDFRRAADQKQFAEAMRIITTEASIEAYDRELLKADISDLIDLEADPFDGVIKIRTKDSEHPDIDNFLAEEFVAKMKGIEIDAKMERIDAISPRMEALLQKLESVDRESNEYQNAELEYRTLVTEARIILHEETRISNYTWSIRTSQPIEGDNFE